MKNNGRRRLTADGRRRLTAGFAFASGGEKSGDGGVVKLELR